MYRAESGEGEGTVTLNDLELASRLSFFLWSSLPDDELLGLAEASRLSKPRVLAAQVKRMLADERAEVARRRFRVSVARTFRSSTRSFRTEASSRRRAACSILAI